MSDNVKDLQDALWDFYSGAGEFNSREILAFVFACAAERGMVVLGPDGEPLDVRPVLRALGEAAWPFKWTTRNGRFHAENRPGALRRLAATNVTGPLASACLAAAEMEAS